MINEAIEDGVNINKISGTPLLVSSNPLWISTRHGMNKRTTKYLINRGADVNYATGFGGTSLLSYWAMNTDVNFCELLIDHGANINQKDDKDYTALEHVLNHSNRSTSTESNIDKIITLLLDHGAKVRPITLELTLKGEASRKTILVRGIIKRVLEEYLKEGNQSNLDPALEAAILGDANKLDSLIQESKINKNDEIQILLSNAAYGNTKTMKLLMEYGNELKYLLQLGGDINCVNHNNTSLLENALSLSMVKFLVENGADTDNDTMRDVLSYVLEYGNTDIVKYLTSKGVNLNPPSTDCSPLHKAIVRGNLHLL